MKPRQDRCPKCGSGKVANILYGLLGFDAQLQAGLDAGEVTLGGCVVTGHDPSWECRECRHRWGEPESGPSGVIEESR